MWHQLRELFLASSVFRGVLVLGVVAGGVMVWQSQSAVPTATPSPDPTPAPTPHPGSVPPAPSPGPLPPSNDPLDVVNDLLRTGVDIATEGAKVTRDVLSDR